MKNFEKMKSQEEILREKISVIEKIQTGVIPRAETILVLLGQKLASEIYLPDKNDAEKVIDDLKSIGLFAAVTREASNGKSVDIGVAGSEEILEELTGTKPNADHRRYGELMGYPATAIDAFIGENAEEKMSFEEQQEMTKNLPDILNHFRFSKQHSQEELQKYKEWLKIVMQNAPELIDELYSKEDADKFRKTLSEE